MSDDALILHVDDNADDRQLFAMAVKRSGLRAQVVSLPSSQAAVLFSSRLGEYAESPTPDLIVLDYDMPWMPGRELIRFIRNAKGMSTVPIVILSGCPDPAVAACSPSFGADAFVKKPATIEELIRAVAGLSRWIQPKKPG